MAERSTQYISWSTIELLKIVEKYRQKMGSEDSSDTDTAFTAKWMIMAVVVVWRDK